jgi:hypothetical protein
MKVVPFAATGSRSEVDAPGVLAADMLSTYTTVHEVSTMIFDCPRGLNERIRWVLLALSQAIVHIHQAAQMRCGDSFGR